jgi:heat shock protein HslJ
MTRFARLLAAVAVFAAADAVAGPLPSGATGEWKLEELAGRAVKSDRPPTLKLTASGVEGHGGCNRYHGALRVAGERLQIGPVVSTRMACSGRMELESTFLAALEGAASMRLEENRLVLVGGGGEAVAVLGRMP